MDVLMKGSAVFILYILVGISSANSSTEYTVTGEISGGNYSYYRLTTEGHIILTLISFVGDADIYISDSMLHPTFDVDSNSLQSVTCGEDVVEITANMKRPIGIGVYAHPTHDLSRYSLRLEAIEDRPDNPYENMGYDYEVSRRLHETYVASSTYKPPTKTPMPPAEDESILWNIFVGILKVLLEVLA